LKIVTWNCNGALRKKLAKLKTYDADIYVIQECENPAETKHDEYTVWAENHLWIGDTKNKGIGIFAKKEIDLKQLNWSDHYKGKRVKHFLPCVVNDDFNLLAIWTHQNNSSSYAYIGQLWKYLQMHKSKLNKSLLIGDFNSNKIWDKPRRHWNHSDVVAELKELGIQSFYHLYFKENFGVETQPTFFLTKKLDKTYHLDYIFGSKEFSRNLKNLELGKVEQWIKISDHLPIFCELNR
jgi:exonuclease III